MSSSPENENKNVTIASIKGRQALDSRGNPTVEAENLEIADFAGLADRQPLLAMAIAIGLFSLAGLPIFAGFTAKFYLFTAVADAGFLWLAAIAIFSSLVSLYYYLQVVRQMYIQPALATPETDDHDQASAAAPSLPRPSTALLAVLVLGLLAVLVLGVYPAPLVDEIGEASRSIMSGG